MFPGGSTNDTGQACAFWPHLSHAHQGAPVQTQQDFRTTGAPCVVQGQRLGVRCLRLLRPAAACCVNAFPHMYLFTWYPSQACP